MKPSNVMLSAEEPGIKNLDFGISKLAVEERDTRLTASSHILGTPESMAPEQVLTPTDITDRCDVYLLGLLLYRMVAARSLYGAESANQFLMAHSFEAPMALTSVAPDVSASLAAVVHACLEKAPSARPAMADVAASLERERGETSALVVSRSLLRTLSDDASHTRPRLGTEAVTRDARGPAVEDAM